MKYSELLKNETKCPFCNRDQEEIIVKNTKAYLTLAKAPYSTNHMMVVPCRHVERIQDLTMQEMADIDLLIKKSCKILNKNGNYDFTILIRSGEKSGRTISHIHYNIIPKVIIGSLKLMSKKIDRRVLTKTQIKNSVKNLKSKL
jgi:ATP adenylyltransferase